MDKNFILVQCGGTCRGKTKHSVKFSEFKRISELEDRYYQVLECRGCENLLFHLSTMDYDNLIQVEDNEANDGFRWEAKLTEETYPNTLEGHEIIFHFPGVPSEVATAYYETIRAFQGGSLLLTALGFRLVLEAIGIAYDCGKKLKPMINKLHENGVITIKERDRLHSVRFLGNTSAHTIFVPQKEQLFQVLEIINNLIKNLYIIDSQMSRTLETIKKTEEELFDLLKRLSYRLKKDKENTLLEILDRHQDLVGLDLQKFEENLIEKIKDKKLDYLKLGNLVNVKGGKKEQTYIYIGKTINDIFNPKFD